jgi:hypothetical protein
MGYLKPKICSEGEIPDPRSYTIAPFSYPEDLNDNGSLIYSLPEDVDVRMSQTLFSAETFDYFNPLFVTKSNVKKMKFCIGLEITRSFKCLQIVIPIKVRPLLHSFACADHQKTVAYTPNLGIRYPTMEVIQLNNASGQMCDVFQIDEQTSQPLANMAPTNMPPRFMEFVMSLSNFIDARGVPLLDDDIEEPEDGQFF